MTSGLGKTDMGQFDHATASWFGSKHDDIDFHIEIESWQYHCFSECAEDLLQALFFAMHPAQKLG
jgi:hypothetical protein